MSIGPAPDKNVLLSATDAIPGYSVVESKGFAMGSAVMFVPYDRVIYAFVRSLWHSTARDDLYSEFFRRLRHKALLRLSENARRMGANAVLGVTLQIWRAGYGIYEAYAYGTAVEVKKE
ncbi:MAG: YbjQ family protein [Candidatus Diapherotrites archaeon]|nr:YbjQ family protein [Candidatus Diapherotrites archaeon]